MDRIYSQPDEQKNPAGLVAINIGLLRQLWCLGETLEGIVAGK